MSSYGRALDSLFQRTTGAVRLGLDRTRALLAELGDPHLSLGTVVHLAGTNGKGSTAATIEALLRARGLRVGKYTSPHLVDFRERIVVDGVAVDPARVVRFVEQQMPAMERIGASFFEATTALAMLHMAEQGVDAAVIETGLGGRLDATNVVRPAVSVITSIGMDHTEYLGGTVEEIAREKAGIFKAGAAAAIGDSEPGIAAMLRERAITAGASPVGVLLDDGWPRDVTVGDQGTSFTLPDADGGAREWHTPLVGAHQAVNTALAMLAMRQLGPGLALDDARCQAALESISVPGRFQRMGRFVLDVAHNPAGAAVLAATVARLELPRPLVTILAVLSDKDWRGIMAALAPVTDLFVLTSAPTAPANRAWDPAVAAEVAHAAGWAAVVEPRLDEAIARGDSEGATVLVTGSFHTVGDVLARLPAASRSS